MRMWHLQMCGRLIGLCGDGWEESEWCFKEDRSDVLLKLLDSSYLLPAITPAVDRFQLAGVIDWLYWDFETGIALLCFAAWVSASPCRRGVNAMCDSVGSRTLLLRRRKEPGWELKNRSHESKLLLAQMNRSELLFDSWVLLTNCSDRDFF